MAMTLAEIRLKQNPILTKLLLGMGQGTLSRLPDAGQRLSPEPFIPP